MTDFAFRSPRVHSTLAVAYHSLGTQHEHLGEMEAALTAYETAKTVSGLCARGDRETVGQINRTLREFKRTYVQYRRHRAARTSNGVRARPQSAGPRVNGGTRGTSARPPRPGGGTRRPASALPSHGGHRRAASSTRGVKLETVRIYSPGLRLGNGEAFAIPSNVGEVAGIDHKTRDHIKPRHSAAKLKPNGKTRPSSARL